MRFSFGRRRQSQLGLDRGDELVLEVVDADLLHDLGEEAEHDETSRLVLRDAARLQVEQLLVVEASGRARVSGAEDVAGLDLEVRDRVGARTLGEHEVAVGLVRVGARGIRSDEHVADPHAARASPCSAPL
jgi:hypothetical protein